MKTALYSAPPNCLEMDSRHSKSVDALKAFRMLLKSSSSRDGAHQWHMSCQNLRALSLKNATIIRRLQANHGKIAYTLHQLIHLGR